MHRRKWMAWIGVGGIVAAAAIGGWKGRKQGAIPHKEKRECISDLVRYPAAWHYALQRVVQDSVRRLAADGVRFEWEGGWAELLNGADSAVELTIHWAGLPPVRLGNRMGKAGWEWRWHTLQGSVQEQVALWTSGSRIRRKVQEVTAAFETICTDSALRWQVRVDPTPTFFLAMPLIGIRMWSSAGQWTIDAARSFRLLSREVVRLRLAIDKDAVFWWMGIPGDSVDVVVGFEVVGEVPDPRALQWAAPHRIGPTPALRLQYEGALEDLPAFLRNVWQRRNEWPFPLIDSPWAVVLPVGADSAAPITWVYFPLEAELSK